MTNNDADRWSLRLFEADLRSLDYSPRTVRLYVDYVRRFLKWCGARGIRGPEEVSPSLIESWRMALYREPCKRRGGTDARPLAHATQARLLTALRSYFRWLKRTQRVAANPTSSVRSPRQTHNLPTVLTHVEVDRLMAVPDLETAKGIRDRTLLEVCYAAGPRTNELTGIRLIDLDLEIGTLRIHQGKGAKDRYVPLGRRGTSWVATYLERARPQLARNGDSGFLFISWTDGSRMARVTAAEIAKRTLKAAGIKKRGALRILRSTCATHMLQGGADLNYVKELLGHESVATTELYLLVAQTQLKEAHKRFHPARLWEPGEFRGGTGSPDA